MNHYLLVLSVTADTIMLADWNVLRTQTGLQSVVSTSEMNLWTWSIQGFKWVRKSLISGRCAAHYLPTLHDGLSCDASQVVYCINLRVLPISSVPLPNSARCNESNNEKSPEKQTIAYPQLTTTRINYSVSRSVVSAGIPQIVPKVSFEDLLLVISCTVLSEPALAIAQFYFRREHESGADITEISRRYQPSFSNCFLLLNYQHFLFNFHKFSDICWTRKPEIWS